MRVIKIFTITSILSLWIWSQSVYEYTVPRIAGGNQPLAVFQGKKILVVTLPVTQNAQADSLLYCLDTLAAAHLQQLVIIASPSIEDGFTSEQRSQLRAWYESKLSNNIVLTDGLYTRKTSGVQQHPLFSWLTNSELNENFDMDVAGPWHKFFISESGQLYGVLRPHTRISSQAVNKTLNMQ